MKTFCLFAILSFSTFTLAQQIPDGCPTDDPALNAAVNNGQMISCQIDFPNGRGGQWQRRPIHPVPRETIELACLAAQDACAGITMCLASDYITCRAQ